MSPREVVIVGYGMAGARLADEIRRRDPIAERVRLTVLGAEKHAAYNRVLLSAVVGLLMLVVCAFRRWRESFWYRPVSLWYGSLPQ